MSTAVHVPRARSSSIRRACSRRARVASVCCGVHCSNTSIFRCASTGTGVLGACVFSLCRTFCDCNRELKSLPVVSTVYTFTCGGVHRAGTSSLCCTCACHGVHRAGTSSVLRRASTSTGVLGACVFSLCRTFCDCNRELKSLPVVSTVYTFTCGGVHRAGTSSLCCTCACHGVHRAGTSSVLRRASTSTGVLAACVFSLCRTFCDCNRKLKSLPVVSTVYTLTCGGVHRAGTSSLCCTCACHGVHRAGTSSVLRRASTSTGVFRACVFSLCRTYCDCNRLLRFFLCCAHRLHMHLW